MDNLSSWLAELGLERYTQVFADNGVDLETLRLLSESELEKLGMLLGHRTRLQLVHRRLRHERPERSQGSSGGAQGIAMSADLARWLQALGLERYVELFTARGVDLAALRFLSKHELREMARAISRCAPARRRPPAAPRR